MRWIALAAVVLLGAAALPFVLRDGPVVPDGAVRARLHVDWHAALPWPADAVVDGDVSSVISALNALRDKAPDVCTAALRPQYRMRFEYPDGSDRTVVFDMNCGTVRSGDVERHGQITTALNAFAESYRAQGGTAPDPPWQW